MKKITLRHFTLVALMGAVSFVLMYFSFSIPILSPFAEFELSSVAEMISGFLLGPLGALEVIGLKLILKLVFKGTSSMLVGEVQNFLLSAAFVLPAVLYYQRHRHKQGAVVGLMLGSGLSVMMAVFTSLYMIFPAYMYLYGMNWGDIVGMCSAVNPWIRDIPTMVACSVIPFNLLSRTVLSLITFILYKKVSVPMKQFVH